MSPPQLRCLTALPDYIRTQTDDCQKQVTSRLWLPRSDQVELDQPLPVALRHERHDQRALQHTWLFQVKPWLPELA